MHLKSNMLSKADITEPIKNYLLLVNQHERSKPFAGDRGGARVGKPKNTEFGL